jgi:hypothetical protein
MIIPIIAGLVDGQTAVDYPSPCRPLEVPVVQAANPVEELQMDKRHCNQKFAGGPLIPTFAKVAAEKGRECESRTTR